MENFYITIVNETNLVFKHKVCSLLFTDWFEYIWEPHNNGLKVKSIAIVLHFELKVIMAH